MEIWPSRERLDISRTGRNYLFRAFNTYDFRQHYTYVDVCLVLLEMCGDFRNTVGQ